jgi:hypothetical protein
MSRLRCILIVLCSRRQLNPAQVVDLSESGMEEALQWCNLTAPAPSYLLVCGGDGTVGWLLNTAEGMGLTQPPVVAILPLGTGNDLARTLGYGSGSDSSEIVSEFMDRLGISCISFTKYQLSAQCSGSNSCFTDTNPGIPMFFMLCIVSVSES